SVVAGALGLLMVVVYGAAATAVGLLAGRYLPAGAAVLLAAGAAVAFQPVRRKLERLADRWVFGARLDGYAVLTRFGSMLETSPGPADLLRRLAAVIRQGLGLEWALVRLDVTTAGGALPAVRAAGVGPARGAAPAPLVPP